MGPFNQRQATGQTVVLSVACYLIVARIYQGCGTVVRACVYIRCTVLARCTNPGFNVAIIDVQYLVTNSGDMFFLFRLGNFLDVCCVSSDAIVQLRMFCDCVDMLTIFIISNYCEIFIFIIYSDTTFLKGPTLLKRKRRLEV